MSGPVHALVATFELHIGQSRSLKAKRAALRPVIDGLRHRFKVSVAEVDHQDTWQRAAIAVALVSSSATQLDEMYDSVARFVDTASDLEMVEAEVRYAEVP